MVPEVNLQADKQTITAFLSEITSGWDELPEPAVLELRCLFPEKTPQIARFNPTSSGMADLAEHAAEMNKYGLNCYIVVNPVRAGAENRSAKDEDIVASHYFWADGDDEEAANSIRNFAGPKYTMAVMTGRVPSPRPHIYWRTEDWVMNLAAWTGIQKAIAARLSTDPTVVNPSRIMRLPGTINWPTDKKAAKGRVPELATMRTEYEDDRDPVSFEQMLRAFGPGPSLSQLAQQASGLHIDTGPQAMDREAARIRALSGDLWNIEVFRLVGSYVRAGLQDGEILALTERLTLPGFTVDQTHREVQGMIDRTRVNPKFEGAGQRDFVPNFDHAPAPSIDAPAPHVDPWRIQSAASFTADFVSPEYIIDGIIRRGCLYTLTAPTGSGKTAVMLYASAAISMGMNFGDAEVEHGDVIFLAGENPDDVRARVIATLEFYGIQPDKCRLHFIPGTFSIRADMERLREEAAKLNNLVMVVIDTFAAYFDGDDENSNAQALDFARVVRKVTQFPGKPAVVMPAHPVKNAARDNLTPKGGSSLLNEVDGNLTLWNDAGVIKLHWQGKFRGAEFEALRFELEKRESDKLKDAKGRRMPTVLAKPLMEMRAIQIARDQLSREDAFLLSLEANPDYTVRAHSDVIGVPSMGAMSRLIDRLAEQGLIKKFRNRWELTKKGERAVEEIGGGKPQPVETEE
ncbi:AAA family ATPase [Paracoccus sp. CPCC 101403]|uniref:AAA family ATPase n=1 Tax=Paracoccus broussonetiae TaxID=3075834 RepID=A0ABU3EAD3_9RHOB|nr:AAA family ATPase [Paracoccus sp. CPCC 101403]MDT1061179.1 AAA family ATPase [Paracoccus sp. CPCC 101403]